MPYWAIETMGYLAAALGTLCWVPQVARTVRTRETRDLSLWTNLMLFTAIMLWFFYGLAIASWPLAASNGAAMLMIGTIVVLKLRHG